MLLTTNDPTSRGTRETIAALKRCDDVMTYRECGWFCVLGYRSGRRLVHAHFASENEYNALRNPIPQRYAPEWPYR